MRLHKRRASFPRAHNIGGVNSRIDPFPFAPNTGSIRPLRALPARLKKRAPLVAAAFLKSVHVMTYVEQTATLTPEYNLRERIGLTAIFETLEPGVIGHPISPNGN
jgi:hypothetical protein